MHIARTVEGRVHEVVAEKVLARGDDGGEVRERAAGREHAAGTASVADDLAEPSDDIRFELRERRRRGEDADVTIDGVGDQVCNRGVKDAAARNVREISRRRRVERARDIFVEQIVKQFVVRHAVLR